MDTISSLYSNPYNYYGSTTQSTSQTSTNTSAISMSPITQTGDIFELSSDLNSLDFVQGLPETEQNSLVNNSSMQQIISSSPYESELNNFSSGMAILQDSNMSVSQTSDLSSLYSLADQMNNLGSSQNTQQTGNQGISKETLQEDMLNNELSSFTAGLALMGGDTSLFSGDSTGIFSLDSQLDMLDNNITPQSMNSITSYGYSPSSGLSYNSDSSSTGSILDSLA